MPGDHRPWECWCNLGDETKRQPVRDACDYHNWAWDWEDQANMMHLSLRTLLPVVPPKTYIRLSAVLHTDTPPLWLPEKTSAGRQLIPRICKALRQRQQLSKQVAGFKPCQKKCQLESSDKDGKTGTGTWNHQPHHWLFHVTTLAGGIPDFGEMAKFR